MLQSLNSILVYSVRGFSTLHLVKNPLTLLMSQRSGYRGRTHVHQRDTNDDAAILGGDIQLQAEHQESVQETKDLGLSDVYRNNLRNRLGHIIEWWKTNYPGYYDVA